MRLRTLLRRPVLALVSTAALAAVAVTCGSAAAAGTSSSGIADGTILVKFRAGIDGAALVAGAGDLLGADTETGVFVVTPHAGETPQAAVSYYTLQPGVEYAEVNVPYHAALANPNDPSYSSQWALAKIRAVQGWAIFPGSYTPAGARIAIVDSGIDSAHPDLADGRVLVSSGAECLSGSCVVSPALDDYGHGTHVAGIAAAATNNGIGVSGVALGSEIVPVKVLDSTGSGSAAATASGIVWAADSGARVINASLSSTAYSKTVCDAVAYAVSAGALVVAAAGNDGTFTNEYPAACAGAIGVAATDANDLTPSWSDYGYPDVFVAAPGVSILSTLPGGTYGTADGTSMAAPFVSGLAALLFAQNTSRSAANVKQIIASSAAKVGTTAYSTDRYSVCSGSCSWNGTYGYGRIDVAQALSGQPTPDFSVSGSPASVSVSKGGKAIYTVSTAAVGGFSGSASLSVTGLPSGATAAFSANPVSVGGSSTLTVTTTTSIASGTYTLTISAVSGGSTRMTSVTMVVLAPDFTVALSPASVTAQQGGSGVFTVSTTALSGFSGTVALSVSGNPTGATSTLLKSSVTVGSSTTLTVKPTTTTPAGTYTLTVTGTSGGKTHTATASLVVVIPDFTLTVSPASATVAHGSYVSFTVSVAPVNGFTGTVTLSVLSGLPTGATATWSRTSITTTGSVTLKITTATSTPAGLYTVTVKGVSGTKTHTANIALTVT